MKHGGDLGEAAARFGRDGPVWLDLSTGINPWPWPVPPGLAGSALTRLPSRAELDALLAAARRAYAVPEELALVAAPGTQALISLIPRLASSGTVRILGPTYAEHAAAWGQAGFAVDLVDDPDILGGRGAHVVVVNPNNPDGRLLPASALIGLAEACRDAGGWLVVDESFADLDPASSVIPFARDLPAVVLRSFGKFFGLPGLRLGFAVAPPGIADALEAGLGPWAVSGPALAIGTRALGDVAWQTGTRRRVGECAARLDRLLQSSGLEVVGGTGLFRLARTPDAGGLHAALARERIWVRIFDWATELLRFGLPADEAAFTRLDAALWIWKADSRDHAQGTSTG